MELILMHTFHTNLKNEVKRKHTTVDPKLQLLLKRNIYLSSLFTTHIAIIDFLLFKRNTPKEHSEACR